MSPAKETFEKIMSEPDMGPYGRPITYVLDENGEPRPATWEEYGEQRVAEKHPMVVSQSWGHFGRWRVDLTHINDDVTVSTVFLGIDHNFCDMGSPILYETAVFSKDNSEIADRYITRADAEKGHKRAVADCKKALRRLHK